jgi:hypothetical protein
MPSREPHTNPTSAVVWGRPWLSKQRSDLRLWTTVNDGGLWIWACKALYTGSIPVAASNCIGRPGHVGPSRAQAFRLTCRSGGHSARYQAWDVLQRATFRRAAP